MTTPARKAEADAVEQVFHLALIELGVATVGEAIALWEDVPPMRRASTSASWLRRAIQLVTTRRAQSRNLARAYYRLVRALRTGTTVADPYHPEPRYITLDVLRDEFAALTTGELPAPPQAGAADAPPATDTADPEEPVEDDVDTSDADADRILVEELDRLAEEEERLEAAAVAELELDLQALGPANLEKQLDGIDTTQPGDDVDRLRADAHESAGARQAAAAARVAMDGARSTIWNHASKDKRVVGYVRMSRTGTPCGWCAMLISRGFVRNPSFYRSEASATYSDGDKYHDNCHCYAVPMFSTEQYAESDLFALNRKYAEEWPRVTKGLSGKAAVSAWRYFIRQEQRAQRRAQVARPPTNVQEA